MMYVPIELCTRLPVEKCTTLQTANVVVFVVQKQLIYAWIKMPHKT